MNPFIVTGATGCLGEKVTQDFAKKKIDVVVVAKDEKKLARLCDVYPNVCFSVCADMSKTEDIENIFKLASEKQIKFSGLIHCAGVNYSFPISVADMDSFMSMMAVNAASFMEMGKYFLKKKYSDEGAYLIAISSMAAVSMPAGMANYSASKEALNVIVKTMAKESVKRRHCVNAIMPGYLEEQMNSEKVFLNDEQKLQIQPFGTIPHEQVIHLIEFLISGKANYITGSIIPIGGGQIQ